MKHPLQSHPQIYKKNSLAAEDIRKKIAGRLCGEKRFEFKTNRFDVIKEKPLIYWWDEAFLKRYAETPKWQTKAKLEEECILLTTLDMFANLGR